MIRKLLVGLALLLGSAGFATSTVLAQGSEDNKPSPPKVDTPEVAEGDSEGSALYGYLAMGFFAGVIIFAVCKSSRRS